MNTKRHPDFIRLKHRIQECNKPEQLERLRQVVLRYGQSHADRAELMAYFLEREYDLNVEMKNDGEKVDVLTRHESEIETEMNRRTLNPNK